MLLENKIIRLGPHKNNKTNDQKIVLAEENFCVYDQDQEDQCILQNLKHLKFIEGWTQQYQF